MSLLLRLPTEVSARVLSDWIKLPEICALEVAHCSTAHRSNFRAILEGSTLRCRISYHRGVGQVDWLLNRKVKLSRLQAGSPPTDQDAAKLVALVRRSASSLTEVELGGDGEVFDAVMLNCRNLEVVELDYCTLSQPYWDMLAGSPILSDIALTNCSLPQGIDTAVACPSVQRLSIDQFTHSDLELAALGACCQLTTYFRSKCGFADLTALPPTLLHLQVSGCAEIGFHALPKSLQELTIARTALDDGDVQGILVSCPHLTLIEFSDNDGAGLIAADIISIGSKYAKSLVRLNIAGCSRSTEAALEHLCKQCTLLEDLNISNNDRLPESAVATILNNSPKLRRFNVNSMRLSDAALRRIAQAPLTALSMDDTTGYTEAGLTALVDGCVDLKSISISGPLFNPFVKVLWSRERPDLVFTL